MNLDLYKKIRLSEAADSLKMEAFEELAKTFGPADKETQDMRDACKLAGYSVVFSEGMTNAQVLDILKTTPHENP